MEYQGYSLKELQEIYDKEVIELGKVYQRQYSLKKSYEDYSNKISKLQRQMEEEESKIVRKSPGN